MNEYFRHKHELLQGQFNDEQQRYQKSSLFSDVTVWVTGRTNPSESILRSLVLQHGGHYEMYYSAKKVTHIIATQLSYTKNKKFEHKQIVTPNWIIDSIRSAKLLPTESYLLDLNRSFIQRRKDLDNNGLETKMECVDTDIDCTDPNFLEKYYSHSRLHHIAIWKDSFREKLGNKVQPLPTTSNLLMHVDIDSFFVSVAVSKNPHLIGLPVAVSNGGKSADVSSCNYEARAFGVKNGMWLGKAKELCKNLVIVDYDFDGYEKTTETMTSIISNYCNRMKILSCDECLVDISQIKTNLEKFIHELRIEIKTAIHCNVSIGVGTNPLTARLAMKKAKPDNQFILLNNIEEFMNGILIRDLPGVGRSYQKKCNELGLTKCSDFHLVSKEYLERELGKAMSNKLINMSKGISKIEDDSEKRKSVSVNVNYGIRFKTNKAIYEFLYCIAKELTERLNKLKMLGSQMVIQVMIKRKDAIEAIKYKGHGEVDVYSKSMDIPDTNNVSTISQHSVKLYKQFNIQPTTLRGIMVQLNKLSLIQRTSVKDSKLFQMLQNTSTKQKLLPKKPSFISLPTKSQIDFTVVNELPNDVRKEVLKQYSIIDEPTDPLLNFKLSERLDPFDVEKTCLFVNEDFELLYPKLMKWLTSTQTPTLFHAEIILQVFQMLCKQHSYQACHKLISVIDITLPKKKWNQIQEVIHHYAEEMYGESFSTFIDGLFPT
ncbi:DNA repair protein REV1 [Entamoeba marina]